MSKKALEKTLHAVLLQEMSSSEPPPAGRNKSGCCSRQTPQAASADMFVSAQSWLWINVISRSPLGNGMVVVTQRR